MHLKRSGNAPLSIFIQVEKWSSFTRLESALTIVVAHAHRWKSLCLVDQCRKEDATVLGEFISNVTTHIEFPSLKHVVIPDFGDAAYPTFLSPACAPALEHLELTEY